MRKLKRVRIARKRELDSIREEGSHHLGYIDNGFRSRSDEWDYIIGLEKTSDWLESNEHNMRRTLPLFSSKGKPLKDYKDVDEYSGEYYDGYDIILNHLDSLVAMRNPKQSVDRNDIPIDWIYDIGCGMGFALFDIAAYYGPILNLRLLGDTLHVPTHKDIIAEEGVYIETAFPGYTGDPMITSDVTGGRGFSLIMANRILIYLSDKLRLADIGRRTLNDIGIFPALKGQLIKGVAIIDGKTTIMSPYEYLDEKFEKMGWTTDNDILIIRKYPIDELNLKYLEHEEAKVILGPHDFDGNMRYYQIRK